MTKRNAHTRHTKRLAALLVVAGLALAGCDSSEIDESDFQFLEGAWTIIEFRIDEQSYQSLLDGRYPNDAVLAFYEADGEVHRFQLNGYTEGGNPLSIDGRVDIDGDEDELFLYEGFSDFVRMAYDLESSQRVMLTADGLDAEIFAETLLDIDVAQDSRLSMTIRRNS